MSYAKDVYQYLVSDYHYDKEKEGDNTRRIDASIKLMRKMDFCPEMAARVIAVFVLLRELPNVKKGAISSFMYRCETSEYSLLFYIVFLLLAAFFAFVMVSVLVWNYGPLGGCG